MIRAGLYCRVSTDEQAENGDSLRTQKDALTQFAKKNNYEIIDTYIDDGYSGTNLNRPQLQRLLKDVQRDKLDIILITKLDRWGRGVSNYYKVNDFLEKYNVHWKTVFEDYDTSTTNGKLMVNIMVSIAENESRTIGDRVKVVIKNKLQNNEWPNKPPFGYKVVNKKLIIDEKESSIVKTAFRLIAEGYSIRQTHLFLLDQWDHSTTTLRKWLSREAYIGKYTKDGKVYTNLIPPIIDDATFNKVQNILNNNTALCKTYAKNSRTYLFSGILFCKECGCAFTSYFHKKEDSEYTVGYLCRKNKTDENCKNKRHITEKYIESKLIEYINKVLEEYSLNQAKQTVVKKESKELDELFILNSKLKELRQMVLDGLIEYPEFVKRCVPYKEEIKKIEKKRQEIEHEKKVNKRQSTILDFFKNNISSQYYSFTRKEKKIFWNNILSKIYIDADRNITFDFKLEEMG